MDILNVVVYLTLTILFTVIRLRVSTLQNVFTLGRLCGYREMETPGSIPNPEAKHLIADNTAPLGCGNVGRRIVPDQFLTIYSLIYSLIYFIHPYISFLYYFTTYYIRYNIYPLFYFIVSTLVYFTSVSLILLSTSYFIYSFPSLYISIV